MSPGSPRAALRSRACPSARHLVGKSVQDSPEEERHENKQQRLVLFPYERSDQFERKFMVIGRGAPGRRPIVLKLWRVLAAKVSEVAERGPPADADRTGGG